MDGYSPKIIFQKNNKNELAMRKKQLCSSFFITIGRCILVNFFLYSHTFATTADVSLNMELNPEMQLVKTYMEEQLPELKSLNTFQKTVLLRNFVYSHINRQGQLIFTPPMTYSKFMDFVTGQVAPQCGILAVEYTALLNLFGISSHYVYLTSDESFSNNGIYDGHIVVETLVDGKWVLQDPTFNVRWKLNGVNLDSVELAKAFSENLNPIAETDGFPLDGFTVESYYFPYKKLFKSIVITTYEVWGDEPCQGRLAIEKIFPTTQEDLSEETFKGNLLFSYNFRQGIPSTWMLSDPNTTVLSDNEDSIAAKEAHSTLITHFPANKVNIEALCRPYGYILQMSAPLELSPGHYYMVVKGKIQQGGINLAILDVLSDTFINQQNYYSTNIQPNQLLINYFIITKPGLYFPILSNNAARYGEISQWSIDEINIYSIDEETRGTHDLSK